MSSKPAPLDDLDALLASPERPQAQDCHVCWALARLDDATADKMRAVLTRKDIPSSKIRAAFRTRLDFVPGDGPMQRHRDGGCKP